MNYFDIVITNTLTNEQEWIPAGIQAELTMEELKLTVKSYVEYMFDNSDTRFSNEQLVNIHVFDDDQIKVLMSVVQPAPEEITCKACPNRVHAMDAHIHNRTVDLYRKYYGAVRSNEQ